MAILLPGVAAPVAVPVGRWVGGGPAGELTPPPRVMLTGGSFAFVIILLTVYLCLIWSCRAQTPPSSPGQDKALIGVCCGIPRPREAQGEGGRALSAPSYPVHGLVSSVARMDENLAFS